MLRTCSPVARHRNHDDVRFHLLQYRIAEAEPIHDARRKVLANDIALRHQLFGDGHSLWLLEVECQAELALIVLVEIAAAIDPCLALGPRRQHARDTGPTRRFDADHLSAEMRELQSAERPGPHPSEVGNA